MPTIEVNYNDLLSLVGEHIPLDVLQAEGILYAKGEVDAIDGEMLKIDIKDTNRPDLWSAEGIARELQGRYGANRGLPEYKTSPSGLEVIVDRKLKNIRPLTVCAVVKGLNITPDVLSQMIQLQEKVSITFGKNRKEVAIGIYDYSRIRSPVRFTAVKPDGIKFVPLEFGEEMTPAEILKKHPKGMEYAHLLKGMKEYPIFIDAAGEVLSMPPVINSNYTGKVSSATRDVFIECSGFDFRFLVPALNVLVAALADRGGTIHSVKVVYPDGAMHTPEMKPGKMLIDPEYANRISGLNLPAKKIIELLQKARYNAKLSGKKIEAVYPAYRQDIMHQRDVVEDIIITYGYNRIEPEVPKLATIGGENDIESFSEVVADIMASMGMQEAMSYMLTSKENLSKKMNAPEEEIVEIENFVSSNWCVFRNRLLPCILEFLSKNKHREYPQKVFEIGDAVQPDPAAETMTRDVRRLAVAVTDSRVGYEQISSMAEALFSSLGLQAEFTETANPSFIKGRTAQIKAGGKVVGVIGEIHPQCLNNWGLEKPVAAFEINLEPLLEMVK